MFGLEFLCVGGIVLGCIIDIVLKRKCLLMRRLGLKFFIFIRLKRLYEDVECFRDCCDCDVF